MEFTDSYGYKPDLLWPWRRLEKGDLDNLLRRRAARERASLQTLADNLPALQKQGDKDPYSYITINSGTDARHGWIIAAYQDTAPNARPTDTVTIAMSDEGELWRGTFDRQQRTLHVEEGYQSPKVGELIARHQAEENGVAAPLINEQDDEFMAAALQDWGNALALTLDFILRPRPLR